MSSPRTRTHSAAAVTLRPVEPGQLWSCGSWIALTLGRRGDESSDMWNCLVLLGPEDNHSRLAEGEVDTFPIGYPTSSWYKL